MTTIISAATHSDHGPEAQTMASPNMVGTADCEAYPWARFVDMPTPLIEPGSRVWVELQVRKLESLAHGCTS